MENTHNRREYVRAVVDSHNNFKGFVRKNISPSKTVDQVLAEMKLGLPKSWRLYGHTFIFIPDAEPSGVNVRQKFGGKRV